MKNTLQFLASVLPLVAAYPAVLEEVQKRQIIYPTVPPPKFTTNRDNCGSHGKCTVFDAQDQFVDVRPGSGHEFKSPVSRTRRCTCMPLLTET